MLVVKAQRVKRRNSWTRFVSGYNWGSSM